MEGEEADENTESGVDPEHATVEGHNRERRRSHGHQQWLDTQIVSTHLVLNRNVPPSVCIPSDLKLDGDPPDLLTMHGASI
jgi:hypothetical protein